MLTLTLASVSIKVLSSGVPPSPLFLRDLTERDLRASSISTPIRSKASTEVLPGRWEPRAAAAPPKMLLLLLPPRPSRTVEQWRREVGEGCCCCPSRAGDEEQGEKKVYHISRIKENNDGMNKESGLG